MVRFEEALGVPAGHTLLEVRNSPQARAPRHGTWEWEHEEYDERGGLVAVHESWTRGRVPPGMDGTSGIVGSVKYSPHGWVLRRVGIPPVRRIGGAAAWPDAA